MPPLHHALFTHAGGEGFRDVFIGPHWPRDEKERLSRWLRSLRLTSNDSPAFATRSFRLGGVIHAVLARVDDTVRDEHDRHGLFVHALLVPVKEGKMPGLFEATLLTLHRRLRKDDAGTERYLMRCRKRRNIKIPRGPGKMLDPFFTELFVNAARGIRSADCELVAPQSMDALPRLLASASGCLPPRLRLASPWAVGLRSTQIWAVLARTADRFDRHFAPQPTQEGMAYVQWLLAHGLADVAGDWEIRSWDDLLKRIRRGW